MSRWLLFLACMTAAISASAGSPIHRVFIAGDSTASEYGPERAPRTGWGQVLQTYLDETWEVRNHAQSGRSSRSFIDQGWLDGIAKDLRKGDVLLIQFGHNDEKIEDPARYNEPLQAYPQWLMRYVALARERGATPILITPVARRKFDHGQLLDTHGLYPQAMRDLAARERIGLIDLHAASMDWLRALGDEPSKAFYMHVPEQGQTDDTHFQRRGAFAVACLVAGSWEKLDPSLKPHLVRDTDCGARPTALADRASQAHPSLVAHDRDIAVVQPGPHGGSGETTAYPFFKDAPEMSFEFRKRALHRGAGIGLHQHDHDEIYYVVSGTGVYTLDGKEHTVGPGNAMLTRPGSTHTIRQTGDEDLVLLITYRKKGAR
ncbi:cupin domain-containing protein [Pseudoxanthomonas sacheonensis]|uniref:cupin domain-containing protein n=1 Tax=Pseudoxanthomonas sacheonensis TaxID=443615 RepID=UPI0013D8091C|nr:rhamnogalacturonan acetylesterase [Pseudoxanthomonas sacheonensis]